MAPKYPLVEWGGGCNLCGHEPWNEGDDHDPGCEGGQYEAEIVRLRTENERLRAALHQILDETTDRIAFARSKGALGMVNPK